MKPPGSGPGAKGEAAPSSQRKRRGQRTRAWREAQGRRGLNRGCPASSRQSAWAGVRVLEAASRGPRVQAVWSEGRGGHCPSPRLTECLDLKFSEWHFLPRGPVAAPGAAAGWAPHVQLLALGSGLHGIRGGGCPPYPGASLVSLGQSFRFHSVLKIPAENRGQVLRTGWGCGGRRHRVAEVRIWANQGKCTAV